MALRQDLAAYLEHGLTAEQVWAANGSNEVIQQLLQAFGGAGHAALGFEPSYSMHPLIARVTGTGWFAACREEDFSIDPERAAAQIRDTRPERGVPDLAQQPDRHLGPAGRDRGPCATPRPAWSWSTRPTPSSAGPGPRVRCRCSRRIRAWS